MQIMRDGSHVSYVDIWEPLFFLVPPDGFIHE